MTSSTQVRRGGSDELDVAEVRRGLQFGILRGLIRRQRQPGGRAEFSPHVRCRALPEVPTMDEAGVKGHEVLEWNPVLAPAGLAPALKTRLRDALREASAEPEVLGRIRSLSGESFPEGPEGLVTAFLKAQQSQWAKVIRDRKITAG
mgnify:CR=1 FL=1